MQKTVTVTVPSFQLSASCDDCLFIDMCKSDGYYGELCKDYSPSAKKIVDDIIDMPCRLLLKSIERPANQRDIEPKEE